MFQLGDTVHYARHRMMVPRMIHGEITKVSAKNVTVRWKRPERMLMWYYRGFHRDSDTLPETTRVAHHNLELIERKGGPW